MYFWFFFFTPFVFKKPPKRPPPTLSRHIHTPLALLFEMNSFTWGKDQTGDTSEGEKGLIREAGRKIFSYQKSDLNINPGAKIFVPLTLNLQEFNRYYVHYFINATVEVDVMWANPKPFLPPSEENPFVLEKTIVLAPTIGEIGRIFSGQTKAQTVKIDFTNVDSVLSLTSISVFVYGVKE